MTIDRVLARGREAAERRMTDTCIIRRQTGETTDPFSGVVTPVYATVYSGPCRVQQRDPSATPVEMGEGRRLMLPLAVHLPVTVIGLAPGDEVEVTTSATDADLVGRVFLIRDLAHKAQATARRVGVEERTT